MSTPGKLVLSEVHVAFDEDAGIRAAPRYLPPTRHPFDIW